mmetsp:Transcript_17071/g.29343  ORF Transcript_17071/g.29343 Transcript_17071/m.29343 type:complete len:569 (+) Transcript_17071:307-2013(+)
MGLRVQSVGESRRTRVWERTLKSPQSRCKSRWSPGKTISVHKANTAKTFHKQTTPRRMLAPMFNGVRKPWGARSGNDALTKCPSWNCEACAACNVQFGMAQGTPRQCCNNFCNRVLCGVCKKTYMNRHAKGLYSCTVHKQEYQHDLALAREGNIKIELPELAAAPSPTASQAASIIFPDDKSMLGRSTEPLIAAPPSSSDMSISNPFLDKSIDSSGSVNSVDILDEMLEPTETSDLKITGTLDTDQDGAAVRPRFWSPDDDNKLRKAVEQYGAKHWKTIATFVPGRNHVQCLQRWNKVLKPGLRKGPWSEEEDKALRETMNQLQGETDWIEIAKSVVGRSAKQCRERWNGTLDPSINRGEWTQDEDAILMKEFATHGSRWTTISLALPGRTENVIKARFKSLERAQMSEWGQEEDETLLQLYSQVGEQWDQISAAIPSKSPEAVQLRFFILSKNKPTQANQPQISFTMSSPIHAPFAPPIYNSQLEPTEYSRENKTTSKDLSKQMLDDLLDDLSSMEVQPQNPPSVSPSNPSEIFSHDGLGMQYEVKNGHWDDDPRSIQSIDMNFDDL